MLYVKLEECPPEHPLIDQIDLMATPDVGVLHTHLPQGYAVEETSVLLFLVLFILITF